MSRKRRQRPAATPTLKFIGIAILAALAGSVLWSMWVDALRPLIQAYVSFVPNLHIFLAIMNELGYRLQPYSETTRAKRV